MEWKWSSLYVFCFSDIICCNEVMCFFRKWLAGKVKGDLICDYKRPWLFHGMEDNTWKTQNSYAHPHCSVWSPQTVYHWIELDKLYVLVPFLLESLLLPRIGSELWVLHKRGWNLPITITLTLTFTFLQYGYRHVRLVGLYPVVYSLWRS